MYLANTLWLIAERLVRLLAVLLVGIYLARYLGPESFGSLSFVVSFVGLFAAVAALGLDGLLIQALVREPARTEQLLGTTFMLKVAGAVLVMAIVAITAGRFASQADVIFMLIVSSALLFDAFGVIDLFFQSRVKSIYTVAARFSQVMVSSALKILMIQLEAGLGVFVFLVLIDAAVLAVSYLVAYKRFGLSVTRWRWHTATAKDLLYQCRYLILADIMISIYARIDKVMIKEFMDLESVGLYTAASNLSEAWYFVPMAICSSVFPMLVAARQEGAEAYLDKVQRLYNLMVWIALLLAVPVTFLADRIVLVAYGEGFAGAGSVLALHIWSGVFVFLGVASGKWLLIEEKLSIVTMRSLAGLAANLVLNYAMIPRFGIAGAAAATVISQCIAALFFDVTDPASRRDFSMKLKALLLIDRRYLDLRAGTRI